MVTGVLGTKICVGCLGTGFILCSVSHLKMQNLRCYWAQFGHLAKALGGPEPKGPKGSWFPLSVGYLINCTLVWVSEDEL